MQTYEIISADSGRVAPESSFLVAAAVLSGTCLAGLLLARGNGFNAAVVTGALICWLAVGSGYRLILTVVATIAAVLLSTGVFGFSMFEQALWLIEQGRTPLQLFLVDDLWWPRFAIAYPAVVLEEYQNWPLDLAYSAYTSVLLVAEVLIVIRIADLSVSRVSGSRTARFVAVAVCTATVFAIASFMNGRMVPAHLGIAMILLAQTAAIRDERIGAGSVLLTGAGGFLSMMSSGAMIVAFAQSAVLPFLPRHPNPIMKLLAIVPLSAVFPLLVQGVEKNLDYWGRDGGGVVDMLSHGWGQFVPRHELWIAIGTVIVLAPMFVYGFRIATRANRRLAPLLLNLPLAGACGVFGYSTLTMGLPAVVALAAIAAASFSDVRTTKPRVEWPLGANQPQEQA